MKIFLRSPEPNGFNEHVRIPGNRWLHNHLISRPKDYWTPFKSYLAGEFNSLCGYSLIFEAVGSVDHYLSCSKPMYRNLSYEWDNYRYASAWMNSKKKNNDSKILDPFDIEDDWFKILLPSLQLVLDETKIPPQFLDKAKFTLEKLELQDHETIIRLRSVWYKMYLEKEITLEGLEKKAPLIARALR